MIEIYEESIEQDVCLRYRDSGLRSAKETCDVSRGKRQHIETLWHYKTVKRKKKVSRNGRKNLLERIGTKQRRLFQVQ